MQTNRRNFIVMCVLLGIAGLISLTLSFNDFSRKDTVDIKNFPRTIGEWSSQEIPLSKEDLAILETDNAFLRRYRSPQGKEVYLYIVYSQTNRKVSHPPEICYTGSGVAIIDSVQKQISAGHQTMTVNRLLLQANHSHQVSFYWFKIGNAYTASYWKQQILIAFNALLGRASSSALIRISTPLHGSPKEADKRLEDFTGLMLQSLSQYLP